MHWWLGIVPEHTVNFFRLTMVTSMLTVLGNTGVTACMASGNIKNYTIILSSIGLLVFPLTVLAYKFGSPAESCYVVYIMVYSVINIVRLFLMKRLVHFPIMMYVNRVIVPIIMVSMTSLVLPTLSYLFLSEGALRFLITAFLCIIGVVLGVVMFGFTRGERAAIFKTVKSKLTW